MTSPQDFGAGAAAEIGQLGESLMKIMDGADLVRVQEALDLRDQQYRDKALQREQNPTALGVIPPDAFINNYRQEAEADDKAMLSTLPPRMAPHAALLFARMRKQAFDRDFTAYKNIWHDQQRGSLITSWNDTEKRIARAETLEEKKFEQDGLNASMAAAQAAGFFKAEEIANRKQNSMSRVEEIEASLLTLNRQAGGPEKVLDNIQKGVYSNLTPEARKGVIENAIRKARANDLEDERNYTKWQRNNYEDAALKADRNELTPDDVTELERAHKVDRAQANELRGIVGKPGEFIAPGVAHDITTETAMGNWSGVAMNKAERALRDLYAKYPKDPSIRESLDYIRREREYQSDRAHTDRERAIQDQGTQLDEWYNRQFHLPGMAGQMQRSKFAAAKDRMKTDIRHGMSPHAAYEKALKSLQEQERKPTSAQDQMREDAGQ